MDKDLQNLENTCWMTRVEWITAKIIQRRGPYWFGFLIFADTKGDGPHELWYPNTLKHITNTDFDLIERIGWRQK